MGYWLKKFTDGTFERGEDRTVALGLASWSKGRLYNMSSVELEHSNLVIKICGEGEYWQSDTYESTFPMPSSRLTRRRIERKIAEQDTFIKVYTNNNKLKISFNSDVRNPGTLLPIEKHMINSWLIAEIYFSNQQWQSRWFINPSRI